jgi:hypothetical protein
MIAAAGIAGAGSTSPPGTSASYITFEKFQGVDAPLKDISMKNLTDRIN